MGFWRSFEKDITSASCCHEERVDLQRRHGRIDEPRDGKLFAHTCQMHFFPYTPTKYQHSQRQFQPQQRQRTGTHLRRFLVHQLFVLFGKLLSRQGRPGQHIHSGIKRPKEHSPSTAAFSCPHVHPPNHPTHLPALFCPSSASEPSLPVPDSQAAVHSSLRPLPPVGGPISAPWSS